MKAKKTKVTGAKTSKYTSKEKKMRDKGARTASGGYGSGVYDMARKDSEFKKHIGTAQNPSAYVGGLREGDGGDTSTIPMRKRTVRSLTYSKTKPGTIKKKKAVIPVPPTKKEARKNRKKKYNKGGFPDLTGDGKVTMADILKGRGVGK